MINIPITKYISSLSGDNILPATFLFYDEDNTGCVTFSPQSGTTLDGRIDTVASFNNENCITEANIKLQVTDISGECIAIASIEVENVCDDLTVTGINFTAPFKYSVAVSGGTPPYSYTWTFNDAVFTADSINQTILDLEPINGAVIPPSSTVSVLVKDSSNCTETLYYTSTYCSPVASDLVLPLICNSLTNGSESPFQQLPVQPCTAIDLNESSYSFTGVPTGVTVFQSSNASGNTIVSFSATSAVNPGTYSINYSVLDEYGVSSNEGTILLQIPNCSNPTAIAIGDQVIQLDDCTLAPGDDIEINIEDYIVPPDQADYDSFQFVDTGNYVTETTQGTAEGYSNNVVYDPVTHIITYTIPSLAGSDTFQWSINNLDVPPQTSNATFFTIVLECTEAPRANADAACSVCGQTVTIDVLDNDSPGNGVLDPSSVNITTSPNNGTAVVNLDGTVDYTPNFGFAGVDTFKYTVNNNNSNQSVGTSNEATVTITVVCAGATTNLAICN